MISFWYGVYSFNYFVFTLTIAPGFEFWISPCTNVLDSLLLPILLAQWIGEHLDTLPHCYWTAVSAPLHMGVDCTSDRQSGWVHGRSPYTNSNYYRVEYLWQRTTHLRVCLLPPVLLYRPKVARRVLVSGLFRHFNGNGWGWHGFRFPKFLLSTYADGLCVVWHGGGVYIGYSNLLEQVSCPGICWRINSGRSISGI